MIEARDALEAALARLLHDAMCLVSHHDGNGTQGPCFASYPYIAAYVAPRLAAALPDGWTLARTQDAEDGAALRELREALGDDTLMRLENLMPDTPREGGSDLWLVEVEVDAPGEPTVLVADATGPTIAAAARKAREALR